MERYRLSLFVIGIQLLRQGVINLRSKEKERAIIVRACEVVKSIFEGFVRAVRLSDSEETRA